MPEAERRLAEGSAAACSSPPGDCSAHTAGQRGRKYDITDHMKKVVIRKRRKQYFAAIPSNRKTD